VVIVAFVVLITVGAHFSATPLVAVAALVLLIGGGNLLYGKDSHGAAAQARVRPHQQARNQAIDEARRRARVPDDGRSVEGARTADGAPGGPGEPPADHPEPGAP
jgi:hypothetical protein